MTAKAEFVHLHNHSEYSLLDGTTRFSDHDGKPSELLRSLAKDGAKGFALTDHGNLYGILEFYTQAKAVGVKPILGCEMYLAKGSRREKSGSQKENCHLTVLARTYEGYQNLLALSSKGFLEGYYYDPRIDKQLLAEHAKGIVVLSGCLKSELNQLLLAGDLARATQLAVEYRDLLEPDCFYLEIMDHGLEKQRQALKGLLEIHQRTKIPLVATNDCHYALPGDHVAHDARVCISTGKLLSDANRLRFESHEFYVKTPVEMAKLFHFAPEALKNTLEIASMCSVQIPMGGSILPLFPVPEGESQDSHLERLAREGLGRLGKSGEREYEDRLRFELGVIRKTGFSGYFLIVWDFIRYAKTHGVPVGPGRGSGAGSLVSYCLDITTVDPIRHRLLFERFLNPDRREMPDLDIDFSDGGRDKVIEYVRGKYGAQNVAQIITFGSLKARLAVRDVGRVLGVPLSEVDALAKQIPMGKTIHQALESVPELQEALKSPHLKQLLDLAHKLEGLKRHTGVHAAGIVITKEAAVKYTPLAKSTHNDAVTTQYDGDYLPKLGLLKMDFLGLRNLSVIENAVGLIRRRRAEPFSIKDVPMDDKKTFELLCSGKALGVFQLDSEGMRDLLRRLKPSTFEDISAVLALYRPGPMKSGMLDEFVERKHGTKKVRYDHPLLEPILQDTYGCIVYQEQVMEIAKRMASYTPGEADALRKAMGKKIVEVMEKERGHFLSGCKKNGIPEKLAEKTYGQMAQFAEYGFNRAHTIAYGMVAYQTAYLKANHPLEYMTALATSEIGHSAVDVEGKENKLVTYIEDAKAMGIPVLGPDVNRSEAAFSIEGEAIRFGLVAVKNVGGLAAEDIAAARGDRPYASLDELCRRVDLKRVNKKTLESLIKAGAMDTLLPGRPIASARAELMAGLEAAMERQARIKEDLARGQGLLFGSELPATTRAGPETEGPAAEPWHEHDLLQHEREVLGFYFSGHPLVRYRALLGCVATHTIAQLASGGPATARLAGMLAEVKRVTTRKGDAMARAVLEDLTGEITLIVFPKAYAAGLAAQLKTNAIVAVTGRVSYRGDLGTEEPSSGQGGGLTAPELIVAELMPLELALNRFARRLTLKVSSAGLEEELLEQLKGLLRRHPGPVPVFLNVETGGEHTLIETEERVELQDRFFEQLGRILGEKSWQIESAS